MKTKLTALLLTGLASTVLAQTPATDATSLMNMGRFGEAKQMLTRAAQQTPTMQSTFDAGYAYLRAGQPDSARTWFQKGLEMDEKREPLNATGVAITYLVQNNMTEATPKIDDVMKVSKGKQASILYRLGEAYTGYLQPGDGSIKPVYPKAVDPAKALDYLNRAAERDKKSADIQLALGDANYQNKDAGTAVSRYESAIEFGMNPARVNQRIGDIYWQGRNLNLAVENYKKAIEVNPQYAPAYGQLAELYFLVNRYKEAANYQDQYVKVSGDRRQDMLLRQAQFHFLAKDYQRAVDLIDSNATTLGTNPILYRIKGWSYSSLEQPQKAIENIQTFLEKAPEKKMSDDYKYMGRAYLGMEATGDNDSLKAMAKAVNDSVGIGYLAIAAPDDTTDNLYSDIAKYYYRTKQHEKALAALDSADKHGYKADVQDLFRYGLSNYVLGFERDTANRLIRNEMRFAKADSALALAQEKAPDYVPTVLYRAKAKYFAYDREEAVRNGKAKEMYEKFITMVSDKPEEVTRYKRDLETAFKYMIAYNELVTKDPAARDEWIKKGLALLPGSKDLAKISSGDDNTDETQ